MSRKTLITRLTLLGLVVNGFLAGEKLFFAVRTRSMALFGDGLDSLGDVVVSLGILLAARFASLPPDERHPWGHGRLDTVTSKVLVFFMFSAGFELTRQAVNRLLSAAPGIQVNGWALAAAALSCVGKLFLASKFQQGYRESDNTVLKANAKNLVSDALLSAAVLLGLLVEALTALPWFDPLLAILVGLWVMWNAVQLFIEVSHETMDAVSNPEVYRRLFAVIAEFPPLHNPHRARIRKIGSLYDVVVDVEAPGQLSLHEVHQLVSEAEARLRLVIPNLFDVVVHVEPENSSNSGEGYGLAPHTIDNI